MDLLCFLILILHLIKALFKPFKNAREKSEENKRINLTEDNHYEKPETAEEIDKRIVITSMDDLKQHETPIAYERSKHEEQNGNGTWRRQTLCFTIYRFA